MDNNTTPTEELIRYLDEDLDAEQRLVVEQKLAADPVLAEQLESLRVAKQAVSSLGLRRKVNTIRKEMLRDIKPEPSLQKPETPVHGIGYWGKRIAAAVVIMVFAAAMYQYVTLSSANMFRDEYETFLLTQGRSVEISVIEKSYTDKDYTKVIELFESGTDVSATANFFAGCAYLQTGVPNKAITSFLRVQQLNQNAPVPLHAEDAQYYLALAYLAHNEPQKALPIFESIHQDPVHAYHDKVSNWDLLKLKLLIRKK